MYKFKNVCVLLIFIVFSNYLDAQNSDCLKVTSFRFIVLGSSTAAGSGVSHIDSSWVNRFRTYLKTINNDNEVINLAVGGYNTYKIMPNSFIPPVGRPSPDSLHNISKALSLKPDAIIINLPSNDVSAGFSINEQLYNFDSLFSFCSNMGIPLWITTTQPRNMTVAQMQMQFQLKDSILLKYAPFAMDFWTDFALMDNSLNNIYDSGDGIHINDFGHSVMSQIVVSFSLIDSLFKLKSSTDFSLVSVKSVDNSICGDSNETFEFLIANVGQVFYDTLSLVLNFRKENSFNIITDSVLIVDGLNSCQIDTLFYDFSTSIKSNYEIVAYIKSDLDTFPYNDSSNIYFNRKGLPHYLELYTDTLCSEGFANLKIEIENGDNVYWYDNPISILPIDSQLIISPFLNKSDTFYTEIIRGPKHFADSLETLSESNVNWNGFMFDVVAYEDLIIDSMAVKVNSLNQQVVEIRHRFGSYKGLENNSYAWSSAIFDTINIVDNSRLVNIQFPAISINSGDTVGFYIKMQNSSSRLSYRTSSSDQVFTDSILSIIAGSGVSHSFGTVYDYRIWNGKVFYHYGYKPKGDCVSPKIPVEVLVSNTSFSIGNDTIIKYSDSLILYAPQGFSAYFWSTGDTGLSIKLKGEDLGAGFHKVVLSLIDSLGCFISDSLNIAVNYPTGLNVLDNSIRVYPNPFDNFIVIDGLDEYSDVKVYDIYGRDISFDLIQSSNSLRIVFDFELAVGVYLINIISLDNLRCSYYVIKQ